MEPNDRIRILQLKARDVKSVREVTIDFAGEIHEIRGDTGQGKSTILDAIEAGLRGMDPAMVRKGANAAEIEITLSNAKIKRIIPADGTRDTVMASDPAGKPIDKAADFLRTICAPSAFRPVEWVQLSGGPALGQTERRRQQRDQLLAALPLALTAKEVAAAVGELGAPFADELTKVALDAIDFDQHAFIVCSRFERACFQHRATLNVVCKEAEARLTLVPPPTRVPPALDAAQLAARAEAATDAYHQAKGASTGLQNQQRRAAELAAQISAEAPELPDPAKLATTLAAYETRSTELSSTIDSLEAQLTKARDEFIEVRRKVAKCNELGAKLAAHEAKRRDLAELQQSLTQANAPDMDRLAQTMANTRADLEARQAQDRHEEAAHTAATAAERAERLTTLVELFRDVIPRRLVERADLPVKNLTISEDTILIDGIPIHQLGTSEQIRVGVLIAAKLNPRSAFILIDGAESLGTKDRVALAMAAHELGLQPIMTFVDADAEPAPGVTVMREGAAQ